MGSSLVVQELLRLIAATVAVTCAWGLATGAVTWASGSATGAVT